MNRIVLVGIAGVAIIVAALGLNFWLNRDSALETVTGPADTPRVVAEPEGVDESTAPNSEEQAQSAGTKAAGSGGQSGTGEGVQPTPSQTETSPSTVPAGSSASSDVASGGDGQQSVQPSAQSQSASTSETGVAPPSGDSAQADKATDPNKPSFDVVRLSQQGDSVMAGRAKPGSTVEILAGDKAIGTVTADERGEWVFLPTEPLPPGNHELSLRAKGAEGDEFSSDHVVVLVVPKKGEDIAGRKTEEDSQPLALLVPSEGGDGTTTILQKPKSVPGGVETESGDLALDSVDYDDKGDLALSGRGKPNASVRVYLNNDFVGEAPVDDEGRWQAKPPENVDPGVYDLRVDQVVEETVVSRLELPFSRSGPITALKDEQLIIVQPGNSLWRIARRTLGEGMSYTVIYDANRNQIRDPDLIYPGQIFQVPKGAVN
ncbi:LysM peptidoglycan-binding domain-containing protein [Hwanghaeella grinnelliae]|uniref:LysM peptidoglycan-binding domain-containing protein n=1 Tax=Hwanghaeella grinnelliae TaxID=2500179 RepID=A0A3S2VN17_9PROT|nr:LysM peptidoglycan-binding domain-containing protein [Hwanghaeella grinnelliae]RVU34707.1 LysM peptidoglycan-binding domain-containing protein [Hwanghaeella grinnelliae]